METLARELAKKVDLICIEYHYMRRTDIVERAKALAGEIQQLVSVLLQGNVFGMEEEEYNSLQSYVIQVLTDYTEAIAQRDMVRMADALEFGLRDLLDIYIDTDSGENQDEQGNI